MINEQLNFKENNDYTENEEEYDYLNESNYANIEERDNNNNNENYLRVRNNRDKASNKIITDTADSWNNKLPNYIVFENKVNNNFYRNYENDNEGNTNELLEIVYPGFPNFNKQMTDYKYFDECNYNCNDNPKKNYDDYLLYDGYIEHQLSNINDPELFFNLNTNINLAKPLIFNNCKEDKNKKKKNKANNQYDYYSKRLAAINKRNKKHNPSYNNKPKQFDNSRIKNLEQGFNLRKVHSGFFDNNLKANEILLDAIKKKKIAIQDKDNDLNAKKISKNKNNYEDKYVEKLSYEKNLQYSEKRNYFQALKELLIKEKQNKIQQRKELSQLIKNDAFENSNSLVQLTKKKVDRYKELNNYKVKVKNINSDNKNYRQTEGRNNDKTNKHTSFKTNNQSNIINSNEKNKIIRNVGHNCNTDYNIEDILCSQLNNNITIPNKEEELYNRKYIDTSKLKQYYQEELQNLNEQYYNNNQPIMNKVTKKVLSKVIFSNIGEITDYIIEELILESVLNLNYIDKLKEEDKQRESLNKIITSSAFTNLFSEINNKEKHLLNYLIEDKNPKIKDVCVNITYGNDNHKETRVNVDVYNNFQSKKIMFEVPILLKKSLVSYQEKYFDYLRSIGTFYKHNIFKLYSQLANEFIQDIFIEEFDALFKQKLEYISQDLIADEIMKINNPNTLFFSK